MIPKIKNFVKDNSTNILYFLLLLLITGFSFSIGFIVAKLEEKDPLVFEEIFSEEEIKELLE